jgi:hypothetical protein
LTFFIAGGSSGRSLLPAARRVAAAEVFLSAMFAGIAPALASSERQNARGAFPRSRACFIQCRCSFLKMVMCHLLRALCACCD